MGRLARHAGVRVFRVFARRLKAGAESADHDCRLLSEEAVLALCSERSLDLAPGKVRAAYARGDLCVGAFSWGELIGYCWFAPSAAPHMDRAWIDFPQDVVYTYKSYVRPPCRGRGYAAAMYRFADRLWLERGRSSAILCVESHNFASVAAARRAGFSPAGYACYTAGARLRAWRSGAAARHGLRFFAPCPTHSPILQP